MTVKGGLIYASSAAGEFAPPTATPKQLINGQVHLLVISRLARQLRYGRQGGHPPREFTELRRNTKHIT